MTSLKIGKYLFYITLVVYFGQNIYFGWNSVPMSEAEEVLDWITAILFFVALFIYFDPVKDLYHNAVKKMESPPVRRRHYYINVVYQDTNIIWGQTSEISICRSDKTVTRSLRKVAGKTIVSELFKKGEKLDNGKIVIKALLYLGEY